MGQASSNLPALTLKNEGQGKLFYLRPAPTLKLRVPDYDEGQLRVPSKPLWALRLEMNSWDWEEYDSLF